MWVNLLYSLKPIEIPTEKISILDHCDLLMPQGGFAPLNRDHLNLGVRHQDLWLHCQIKNSSNQRQTYALHISSPLLEHISLIDANQTIERGMLVASSAKKTLSYYFPITLAPKDMQDYYLRVKTIYTPLDFSLFLEEMGSFLEQDRSRQMITIFLLGIIVALMIYAFVLSFYTGDRSYLFYALYLLTLLYQQMTYLGLMQLYVPTWFIRIDAKITIIKIASLIISSALFAMSFLETKHTAKWLHRGYLLVILLSLFGVAVLDPREEISLYLMILMGAVFILYNLISGILIYLGGKKEARLFIVGFALVFFSYLLMIIDALGIASVMLHFRSLLILTTAIEAFVLSLAFADRYLILQKSKARVDQLRLAEAKSREKIIHHEVVKKTKALNQALHEKELLMREIHHRVKNNLQIILSIIRLQSDTIEDRQSRELISQLEMRINAIAKSYTNLITSESLHWVDMDRYLSLLLEDLIALYDPNHLIKIEKDITIRLPFKRAVYIGLIINELVSNAFKHAFDGEGKIEIRLYREEEDKIILILRDNGKGFIKKSNASSLGLMLMEILVTGQLRGSLVCDSTESGTVYKIGFEE